MKSIRDHLKQLTLALALGAGLGAGSAQAGTINVNVGNAGGGNALNGRAYMTGGYAQAPLSYAGNTWNDNSATPGYTVTGLLDSQGTATNVGFTTVMTDNPNYMQGPNNWADHPDVPLLQGGLIRVWNSSSGNAMHNRFTITGLTPNGLYHVAVVGCQQDNAAPALWGIGTSSTAPAFTKLISNALPVHENWVADDNYAAFYRTAADGSGNIYVWGQATSLNYNGTMNGLTLNGFQIMDAADMLSPDNDITSFGPGAVIAGTYIVWSAPFGMDVTSLAPTYTVSPGASQDATYPSGTTRNFTAPQTYTITAENGASKTYTVTATVPPGALNYRSYDASVGTTMLNPISDLLAVTPSASGIISNNIYYPSTFAGFPGITAQDTFSVIWDGWLDVPRAGGHGDYTFGTASDDGSVVYVDLNNDGIFDPATELVVNNNAVQATTQVSGTVTINMDTVHVLIGYFQDGGGLSMEARFAKGTGVAWGSMLPIGGTTADFLPTAPATTPKADMYNFTFPTFGNATITGLNVTKIVPNGTDVTNLAPTFTLSPGATCVPVSGSTKDFTSQQTYTVTSSDTLITKNYLVTVTVAPPETTLIWNLVGGGTWDTSTANWIGQTSSVVMPFFNGAGVIFNNPAGGTIDILAGMAPASTTVSAGSYTFSGGPLAGSGSLTKDGSGMLKIDDLVTGTGDVVQNTYSGGTIMNSGTLHLGGMFAGISPDCRGALGTGTVTLNAGTIEFDRYTETNALIANGGTLYSQNGWGATWSGPITLNATLTCNAGYGLTCSGAISGTGGLNKTGGDVLVLSGTNSYTGKTIVNSGRLQYNVPLSNAGAAGALGAPTGTNAVIDLYPGTTFLYGGPQGSVSPPMSSTDRTINLAGAGSGTVTLNGNNVNDTGFQFGGFSATGTGTRTLLINCQGDRPVYTYTGGIPDMSDSSQVSLTCTWSSGSSSSNGLINLQGIHTFTGPITLNGGNNGGPATFLIGGSASNYDTVVPGGSGVLGNGNYAGNITFTANPASVILYYASASNQTLSGAISGPGALTVGGTGVLTLAGTATHTGNTTVNSGSALVLDPAGTLTFKLADTTAINKLTGPGTANLNGHFAIDTSALGAGVATGSWTLVDVATKNYGGTFGLPGFTGPVGTVFTKVAGAQTWTFDTATGVLHLSAPALITSFSYLTYNGSINQSALTIHLTVPHGTALAAIAPTFTLSSGTCNQTSGSPPSPTFAAQNPATYTVTDATAPATNHYTVTVTVLPPGPPVSDYARWFDASALGLANNAGVSNWPDGSVNHANATVPDGNATPVYVANSGMESGLGAIYFAKNDGANNSGALRFTRDTNIRTVFSVFKGASFLLTDADTYNFHRPGDDNPADPLIVNYDAGPIVAGSTYVNGAKVDPENYPMPTDVHNGFNLVEILTNGDAVNADSFNKDRVYHAGNQYQAEVIIYDRVLTEEERLQVETYLTSKWFASASDYGNWLKGFTFAPGADTTPTGDPDGDGLTNFQEYAFGLDPTSGKSCNAITVPLNKSTGTFEYTRRATPAATGLTYTVLTSTDLVNWTPDAGSNESVTTVGDVQTVTFTVTASPVNGKLFVRVSATDVPAPPVGG